MKKILNVLLLVFVLSPALLKAKDFRNDSPSGPGTDFLDAIVVTATRTEREVFATPQFVSVISAEEIALGNAPATPDLLLGHPGILVQKTNHGGGSPFIRGITGKQVLLLVDGIRLNNSLYRSGPHQYLNTIDPGQIERIEVLRGPGSVLYGSDALGGVINIITRKREDFSRPADAGGLVSGRFGSADRHWAARAQVTANLRNFGLVGGGSFRDFDHLSGGRDVGVQRPTAYEEAAADLKLNYRFGDRQEVILAHQYLRQFDVPKTSEVTLGGKTKFNYEPQVRSLSYLEYRARHHFPGIRNLRVNLSYNFQEEGEEIIGSDPAIETRERNRARTLGSFFQASTPAGGSNLLSYGAEFYRDEIASSKKIMNLPAGTFGPARSAFPNGSYYDTFGVFLQDEMKLGKRWFLILGGRYSRFSTEGTLTDPGTGEDIRLSLATDDFSGSLNALFRLTGSMNLVGGVAQGFRAPNLEDFFGKVDFFTEKPNPGLDPEKSTNYEAGIKWSHPRVRGEAYYFLTDYRDLITRETIGYIDADLDGIQDEEETDILQRRNTGRAWIQGAEFNLVLTLDRAWSLSGNCAWTWGENRDTGRPLSRIPPVTGRIGIRYQDGEHFWMEGYSLFAGRQSRLSPGDISDPRIPEEGTPGYLTLNLRQGFKIFDRADILLTIENLTDASYRTHGSGVYSPGTNFLAEARIPF